MGCGLGGWGYDRWPLSWYLLCASEYKVDVRFERIRYNSSVARANTYTFLWSSGYTPDRQQLTQPEGTWCFWAPEICTTSTVASERAIQAAATRARGAEAAKAMALGISSGGGGGLSASESVVSSKVGGCLRGRFGTSR